MGLIPQSVYLCMIYEKLPQFIPQLFTVVD